MVAPSGSVMRTGGILAPVCGGSMKVALKPKSVGHFLGFLAVAAFPSALSTRAYARSPSKPRSVTSLALTSSPSIDLTGYRHNEATEPCVAALTMSSSSCYLGAVCTHTATDEDQMPVMVAQTMSAFCRWGPQTRPATLATVDTAAHGST